MLIGKLLEEMMGEHAEFETLYVLLPVDDATQARDLANKLGVPANRLLAELVRKSLPEAQSEWRMLTFNEGQKGERAPAHPLLSLEVPPRVK